MPHTKILIAIVFLVLPFRAICQKIIESASGQRIELHSDRRWNVLHSTLDSLKALEGYEDDVPSIDGNQSNQLNTFIQELKDKEAWSRVLLELTYEDLATEKLNLNFAKKEKNKDLVKTTKKSIKSLKKLIRTADREQYYYAKKMKRAKRLYTSNPEKFDKRFYKIAQNVWEDKGWTIPSLDFEKEVEDQEAIVKVEKKKRKNKKRKRKKKVETSAEEVLVNESLESSEAIASRTISTVRYEASSPPTPSSAAILFDAYDEIAEADRKQLKYEQLFTYTHPKMKAYFKDTPYLTCDASLSKVDGDYFIVLDITMLSRDAARSYGMIRQTDQIRLTTIDDSHLYATVIRDVAGKLEEYTGNTTYEIVASIKKSSLKKLRKTYLDSVGILWTSGFESYPVYDVALLSNQATLLFKK